MPVKQVLQKLNEFWGNIGTKKHQDATRMQLPHLKEWFIKIRPKQQINELDVIIFLRQFATLIASGISILKTCDILIKTQHKHAMANLILSIKQHILAGNTLFSALKIHPYFDELTCQLIHVGEHTGKLDMMLIAVADHHEKHWNFKKQIRQTLFYPTIILCAALILILFLLVCIIPKFAELFNQQASLPLLTRCLFSLSYLFLSFGKFLLIACLLGSFFIYYKYRLIVPLINKQLSKFSFIYSYLFKIILIRFTRHLAIALAAGIPLIDALSLIEKITDTFGFSNTVIKIRHKITSGMSFHQAMEQSGHFPLLLIQMIKIGEESGTIEQMLSKVAQIFEADTTRLLNNLMQILEPLIMAILGVLIGGLVIGMYLPIFKLGNTL